MDILNPPKSYIDYRCTTNGLSGEELTKSHDRFYKSRYKEKVEICSFFNWLLKKRQEWSLPFEKIEVHESDGKKRGKVVSMMIVDIEYWVENGEIKQRKIYMAKQGEI